jgi:hypothetical protein
MPIALASQGIIPNTNPMYTLWIIIALLAGFVIGMLFMMHVFEGGE